jgi:hypothetical protein
MKNRCKNCKYSHTEKQGETEQLWCRRNPPVPYPMQVKHPITGEVALNVQAFWPPVLPDMQCGEFDQKSPKHGPVLVP